MKYRRVFEALGMIAFAGVLFAAARIVKIETVVDKIMVPFAYVGAVLFLIAAIIMFTPVGRRISPMIDEVGKKEKEANLAKFTASPLKFTLRRTVYGVVPVIIVLGVLHLAGEFESFSKLLIWCCIFALFYLLITYTYFKYLTNKNLKQ